MGEYVALSSLMREMNTHNHLKEATNKPATAVIFILSEERALRGRFLVTRLVNVW